MHARSERSFEIFRKHPQKPHFWVSKLSWSSLGFACGDQKLFLLPRPMSSRWSFPFWLLRDLHPEKSRTFQKWLCVTRSAKPFTELSKVCELCCIFYVTVILLIYFSTTAVSPSKGLNRQPEPLGKGRRLCLWQRTLFTNPGFRAKPNRIMTMTWTKESCILQEVSAAVISGSGHISDFCIFAICDIYLVSCFLWTCRKFEGSMIITWKDERNAFSKLYRIIWMLTHMTSELLIREGRYLTALWEFRCHIMVWNFKYGLYLHFFSTGNLYFNVPYQYCASLRSAPFVLWQCLIHLLTK